jgi:hypothetical protein
MSALLLLLFRQNASLATSNKLLSLRVEALEKKIASSITSYDSTNISFYPLQSDTDYLELCEKTNDGTFEQGVVCY